MAQSPRVDLPSHEELAQLASDNPQAFEALRQEVIDSFIEHAPTRLEARLRGLQFRVDCQRRLSHSALGATVRVYQLMWESFLDLNDGWQTLVKEVDARLSPHAVDPPAPAAPNESARILEFRPRSPSEKP
jgi:hypothetical protein